MVSPVFTNLYTYVGIGAVTIPLLIERRSTTIVP